jgi:hypothetical protein
MEEYHLPLLPRRLLRLILLRALLIWVGVRLLVLMGGAMIGELLLRISALSVITIILVSAFLTLADLTRRREALFLANLGVPTRMIVLLSVIPAALGEMVLAVWVS